MAEPWLPSARSADAGRAFSFRGMNTVAQIAERAAGLEYVSSAMGPMNRELGPRMKAAVAASAELQERDALKNVGLAAATTTALIARGVPDSTANLAGELGVLAFKRGYSEWSEGDRESGNDLAHYTLAALDELRAATASLG